MQIGEITEYAYPDELEEGELAYEVFAEDPEIIFGHAHRESYLREVLQRAEQ